MTEVGRKWRRPTANVWLYGEPITGGSVLRDGPSYIVHGWRDWGVESMGQAGLLTLPIAQKTVERWLSKATTKPPKGKGGK